MAFPPAPLPINKTDATDQDIDHPNTHNAIAQAINDTVPVVQANGLDLTNLRATVVNNGRIEHGVNVVTLDAASATQINFPTAFSAQPSVSICWAQAGGAGTALPVFCIIVDLTATHVSVRVLNSSQASMAGQPATLVWIAVGAF